MASCRVTTFSSQGDRGAGLVLALDVLSRPTHLETRSASCERLVLPRPRQVTRPDCACSDFPVVLAPGPSQRFFAILCLVVDLDGVDGVGSIETIPRQPGSKGSSMRMGSLAG